MGQQQTAGRAKADGDPGGLGPALTAPAGDEEVQGMWAVLEARKKSDQVEDGEGGEGA